MLNNLNITFMKRVLLIFALLLSINVAPYVDARLSSNKKMPYVEVVNDQTVIFKNVIKIEIRTNREDQITYVYDMNRSKLASVSKGAFEVNLPYGDYLVQSNRRITKTDYQTISVD